MMAPARRAERNAALAALRARKAEGKSYLSSYQVAEAQDIYDQVDEEGYKKRVRERLDQDDFVVDDNGDGYADDGREEWDTERRYASESEEELPALKGKNSKRKREEELEKLEKSNHNINKYFNSGAAAQATKPKPKPVNTAEDAAFMAGLLGEVDTNLPTRSAVPRAKPIKLDTRRKVRVLSPPVELKPKASRQPAAPHTPPDENDFPNDEPGDFLPENDDDVLMSDPLPSSPMAKAAERKHTNIKTEEDDEEDGMEISQAVADHTIKQSKVNITGSRPPIKKINDRTSLPTPINSSPTRPAAGAVDPSAWNDISAKLNVVSSPAETVSPGKLKVDDAMEDDGTVRIFWTDYTDINGSLCLFGKVKDKKSGKYVSAFVKVDGILRKLYFLPRENRKKNGRDTDETVNLEDVYNEIDELMTKQRVTKHKMKPSNRKYAFEKYEIPREAEYMRLFYSYDKPALPMDLQGETFSHVFGTNTNLFEQFVLWKNIMGPCWLQIEADAFTTMPNASWCKLELHVDNAKHISVLADSENVEIPTMTYMSLAFRTMLNTQDNKQEILMASARVYESVSLNDTTPADRLPCKTFTLVRPIENSFPLGFEAACKQQRGTILTLKTEQMLLAKFLDIVEKVDPDVLMGHGLQDGDYPILLNRLREKKVGKWHRIGRLHRSEWPKSMFKGGNNFFAERSIVAGRLICDIANDMGKSTMTKCVSWTMSEMCSLYLGQGIIRQEIDNDAALKSWARTKDGLLNYLNHCETDTYFIAAIALGVQILPLSKVLTNLAGNSWARTLTGTRSERNEYILLHEFYKNKYICPDKVWGKGKIQSSEDDEEDGSDTKKKDKYKGGLVFEPEKGLYDKFILVMDFNSLYPSIIQEYNICFTTVERSDLGDDDDKVPEVPAEQKLGILPKLIATLVSRRREVKKLMKNKSASPEEIRTWDIKQTALKLTANSMYGCLGYNKSRFYARPLAMLTTSKGREILRSTKDLAEGKDLRVVYGDTDSVMINTNVESIAEALKLGNDFKRSVNEQYRLLEIDIDNVFRRLLLHAKKKYAAVNMVEVDGKYVEKLEVKGLDMKRREYCALSKEASSRLLNIIFAGDDAEVVITKIQDYLRELASQMREDKIATQKYIIYTKLGKDPKSYPNADSMPQVQVALRALQEGKQVRVNDVMSYITCLPATDKEMDMNSSMPAPKRARSFLEVQKAAGDLKPDHEWYLAKQILPPIERLCAPMAGIDGGQIAECLGLDPKKYASLLSGDSSSGAGIEITPLNSQLPDSIRYKACPRLSLTCVKCKESFAFEGLANSASAAYMTSRSIHCPSESCGAAFRTLTIVSQVESQIRRLTSSYYDAWLVCDDPGCGNRTKSVSVYGHRCLGPQGLARNCLGRMTLELSGKVVGSTFSYWRGLWDADYKSSSVAETSEEAERWRALRSTENRTLFDVVKGIVEGYEKKCGWVWVQMDGLFGFALK